ncbi:Clp protease [Kitasatospora sp. RB6PN24]|uniref:Clp protease N-terminal domain-containing protein n=1 Tax=Kitasatospora humi TaxID=2893891 RepID=UPI001E422179|nr:Clp protease N-terminal domain-containing protein [Kitasatospora humi]MCC9307919.1 Clp protease [Kitasatospora humi]
MTAIDTYLHAIVVRAVREAREDASATVEAQHLLLGIADEPEATVREVLTSAGLDHRALREALGREFEHSLQTVGVSAAAHRLPRPSPACEQPKLGASAKLAMERGFASVSRKRDLRPAHLLLGVLQAQLGTVPRALALAGVDQAALLAQLRQELETTRDGGVARARGAAG